MNLFIVLEYDTHEVIGVYDTFAAAKIAGEIWVNRFYIVERVLNAPAVINSSGGRVNSIIYDTNM